MREPAFWQAPKSAGLSLRARALAPAAFLYGTASRLKRRFAKPEKCSVPVLCIGNIRAGGVGKTPLAILVADHLRRTGETFAFLTRGYGGREKGPLRVDPARHSAEDVGDEALLLAAVAPTWVSANRAEGAAAAVRDGAHLIVMDDGLQNPGLEKDFSLLVIDAVTGLGNGRLIPAGPLRETVDECLTRINAVAVIGKGHAADGVAARAGARGLPIFHFLFRPAPAPELDGAPVLAFTGIGRPQKFFATLLELHAEIVATQSFGDHHMFTEREALNLLLKAQELNATLVTTEKDMARLQHAAAGTSLARLRNETRIISIKPITDDLPGFFRHIDDAIAAAR